MRVGFYAYSPLGIFLGKPHPQRIKTSEGLIKSKMEIINLLLAYIALHLAILWHEIGHFGRPRYTYNFLIPVMFAEKSKSTIGGLIFNIIGFYGIFLLNPSNLLFLYFGLFSWLHFLSYALIEPIFPLRTKISLLIGDAKMGRIGDIGRLDKSLQILFFIIAVFVLFQLKDFYIPILTQLIYSILG